MQSIEEMQREAEVGYQRRKAAFCGTWDSEAAHRDFELAWAEGLEAEVCEHFTAAVKERPSFTRGILDACRLAYVRGWRDCDWAHTPGSGT